MQHPLAADSSERTMNIPQTITLIASTVALALAALTWWKQRGLK